MAYSAPPFENILAGILRDIRSLQPEADIGTDSDHYVRSAAVAAAIEGIYQKLAWLYRQIFPDTADKDELVRTAAARGVFLKLAVGAGDSVALTGAPGVELLQGATFKHLASGELFTATSSAMIGIDGTATVSVVAQTPGTALNDLTGALTLTSPPLGMDAAAVFIGSTTGGEDEETFESLLVRLLEIMQEPPAGGATYDYARWAKEVPGVVDALVLPKRRGGGTVDVVITGSDGVPSAEVTAACQAHIEDQCTVIGDIWVFVPIEREVNSTALVELTGDYTLPVVQGFAQKAYTALLAAKKPRESLKRSQIEAMINNLPGVSDRVVNTPPGNVAASDDPVQIGWIRPGTITLGLMP